MLVIQILIGPGNPIIQSDFLDWKHLGNKQKEHTGLRMRMSVHMLGACAHQNTYTTTKRKYDHAITREEATRNRK